MACYALDYKDRRADNIIVSLTDSLLIFCEPDDIVERTDGFYAYDYRKFLSSKYLIKRGFVERNFMPRVRKIFVHNYHSLQDEISIDTLNFDIKEWITSNLKLPRDYKGKIVKYVTNVQLVFNRKGEVTDVCFDKIFDQELADYIANELKKMPSVGTLAPKKEYPVSHYKNYTFKTSQSIKIKLER